MAESAADGQHLGEIAAHEALPVIWILAVVAQLEAPFHGCSAENLLVSLRFENQDTLYGDMPTATPLDIRRKATENIHMGFALSELHL